MNRILELAYKTWCAGAGLRSRRHRYKSYTYGDQWCDTVRDRHGRYMREDARIIESGSKPLTNNLIRQLVKTVVGRYRTQSAESGLYSGEVAEPARRNGLAELESRLLEEFLISGCAVQRVVSERRMQGTGVWVDNVCPDRFFVNAYRDPRGFDIELAGMLHDMSPAELLARFAGADAAKAQRIRRSYSAAEAALPPTSASLDFFTAPAGKWRVVEMWTLDAVVRPAGRRRASARCAATEFVWQCRWASVCRKVLSAHRRRGALFCRRFARPAAVY